MLARGSRCARAFANHVCDKRFSLTSFKQMPKKNKREVGAPAEVTVPEAITESGADVLLRIHAKPGAKHNSITGIGEEVGVQIAAPPVDGEANTQLIKYLAKLLGLSKSKVSLHKGSKSRNKVLLLNGLSKDEVLKKLTDSIDKT